ncbi:putative C-terminal motor kinesin [Trypanosoma conorhini]|uniref:Kinesin-like protein n=1 Tax=Trypanosoma conorhini TaxID=83891 RepID=A0A3R7N981_9TRYP|nr:putative C-terminal motor kinesin [Trypanosoma conorhini]RNF27521.1 putative C-terminal motor kinesin [Trypanosoma conorhini]
MRQRAQKRPRQSDEGNILPVHKGSGGGFTVRRPPLTSSVAATAPAGDGATVTFSPAPTTAMDLLWQRKTAVVQRQLLQLANLYAQKSQENETVLDAIERMVASHELELAAVAAESESHRRKHLELLAELHRREDATLAEKQRAMDEITMLQTRHVQLEQARERLQEDIVVQSDALEQLQKTLETQRLVTEEEQRKLNDVLERERVMQDVAYGLSGEVREMVVELEQIRKLREAAERASKETEILRRQLYSQCEELKGTIRVYCRVKGDGNSSNNEAFPAFENCREVSVSSRSTISLSTEGLHNPVVAVGRGAEVKRQKLQGGQAKTLHSRFLFPQAGEEVQQTLCLCQSRNNATSTGTQEAKETFTFDRVFDGSATQAAVYADVEPLVNCAVDGYRVCIFAYGQTGSGKTYSMEGEVLSEERCGITPRALRTIFRRQDELKSDGWKYNLSCYFIEIYNDVIRDLQQEPSLYEPGGAAASQANYHVIKHQNESGSTSVTNVVERRIRSLEEFQRHYKAAMKNRSTSKTLLNDHSSRSHCIFVLRIEGENALLRQRSEGTLCLVDLAGSERMNESGTGQGQQIKETININRSLLDLGKCIRALNNSGSVAPWRNCKLTYLLQNYLGAKGGKMLMLVTVSDKEEYMAESLNSLRFASRVNQTVVGPSMKRVKNY